MTKPTMRRDRGYLQERPKRVEQYIEHLNFCPHPTSYTLTNDYGYKTVVQHTGDLTFRKNSGSICDGNEHSRQGG